MQILIVYHSKGGNTKKLAEAIAKGINKVEGVNALLKRAEEVTKEDFLNSEGVIAGSPVYFGVMAAELKKIFEESLKSSMKCRKSEGRHLAKLTPEERSSEKAKKEMEKLSGLAEWKK